jgi:hypothetical protein
MACTDCGTKPGAILSISQNTKKASGHATKNNHFETMPIAA